MKLNFLEGFFKNSSTIKFNENPPIGSRVVPLGRIGGRTDMKKLIVAYGNFANSPKIYVGSLLYDNKDKRSNVRIT